MADSEGASERRLAELEMRITYQERTIEELGGQVFDQARRLEGAEKLLRDMAEKLKELVGDGSPLPPNERPPHY